MMIETRGLRKSFGTHVVLDGINLNVAAGTIFALLTLAITWMGVVFGLVGKTPAGANSLSLIFQLLAFTSSAFVSPDSMPAGVRWFAQYQPFTPAIDTLRGLLLGTPISGTSAVLAVAWCAVLILVGYLKGSALSTFAYSFQVWIS